MRLIAVLFLSLWAMAVAAGPLERLQAKAEREHSPEDEYALGMWYYTGWNTTQDYQQAAQWLTLAADQGHAGALRQLGQMYSRGQGVPKDAGKSQQLLLAGAMNGDALAATTVAWRYKDATGGEDVVDLVEAYAWFSVAAALGEDEGLKSSNIRNELGEANLDAANARASALLEQVRQNIAQWEKRFPSR